MSKCINPYVYGKFSEARGYMARSPRSLKERIEVAYSNWLIVIRDGDLPNELKGDFAELKSRLAVKTRSDGQGSVAATLSTMHWRHVRKCADLIVSLADRVEDLVDPNFDYERAA